MLAASLPECGGPEVPGPGYHPYTPLESSIKAGTKSGISGPTPASITFMVSGRALKIPESMHLMWVWANGSHRIDDMCLKKIDAQFVRTKSANR